MHGDPTFDLKTATKRLSSSGIFFSSKVKAAIFFSVVMQ